MLGGSSAVEQGGEDILLVPLFGHTHGHCGVAVACGGEWLLAAGDAYFDAREIKLPRRQCAPGPALFQMVVTTEFEGRRRNQDRLRALHMDHPEIEIFAAHNPFEYLDLVDSTGGSAQGVYPTRRWKPRNHDVGAARPGHSHAASGR
ncbi:hypothetical protein ACIHAA_31375 [Streptomyces sp. NPDC052040]|uniref:hypothetical protein n=1 Tax=Streptomyces sp. NPDC052040 TaxID=3365682 RepID=UPI0037D18399